MPEWVGQNVATGYFLLNYEVECKPTVPNTNKMKPTNPNADTYVEKQKQYLYITFSSEPTCGTP